MIKVKVCGLTEPANISTIASSGADYLGFIFCKESKRYAGGLDPDSVRRIDGPAIRAGVFVNESIVSILEIVKLFDLLMVQLHGNEQPEFCRKLKQYGLIVIKTFGINDARSLAELDDFKEVCDYFLFDTRSGKFGGTGKKFDWRLLNNNILTKKPFFLSGGIGYEDVQKILEIKNDMLFAVDINSRFETAPGIKDAVLVRQFINKIKSL